MTTTPRVYAAIAAVTAELGIEGIAKERANSQQGYRFRGIDDVYNALSPILSKHNLCMLPRILSREVVERQTAKGTALFYVTVEAEFDLVSAEDASKHTIRTYGEAMDSADKATNKAMSAAYKYAAMQAFAIPTEGDNDADATTHEVAAAPKMLVKDQRVLWTEMRDALNGCATLVELATMWSGVEFQASLKKLKPDWQQQLREHKDECKAALEERGGSVVPANFDGLDRTPSPEMEAAE